MHMLLFEAIPFADRRNEYLDIAARLKVELDRTGGCRYIERFRHAHASDRLLSFQLWEDEAAITAWRINAAHHEVQLYSRDKVFEDYRLRVAEVHPDPEASPIRISAALAAGRLVVALQSSIPYLPTADREGLAVETFTSLYRADQYLHLIEPVTGQLDQVRALCARVPHDSCHLAQVGRDYSLFDRDDAPQVCPLVRRG